MVMFREWQPLTAWLNSGVAQIAPEDEFDCANDIRLALERQIMNEPARDMRDVLAKMLAWTHYGEDDLLPSAHLPQLWAEARALTGVDLFAL